jgi:hypothetical protein
MKTPLWFSGMPALAVLTCLLFVAAPAQAQPYGVAYNSIWQDGTGVSAYVATTVDGFYSYCSEMYFPGCVWQFTTSVQGQLMRDGATVDSDWGSGYDSQAGVYLYDEIPPGGYYNYESWAWHNADWFWDPWGTMAYEWGYISGDTRQDIYVSGPPPPIFQYPEGYLDEMPGELLEYGSVDDYGGVSDALLDPGASDYLISSGFLQVAETLPQLVETGWLLVVETVAVAGTLTYEAVEWLHRRGLGSDPEAVKRLPRNRAGTRDENGNCVQVLPPHLSFKRRARNWVNGGWGPIHWHWTR